MSHHISENRPPIARFGGPRHKAIAEIRCVPLIKELSLKAASRLALLLNTIFG